MVNFDTVGSKDLSFGNDLGISPQDIDNIALGSLKGAPGLHLNPKRLTVLTSKQKLSVLPSILAKLKSSIDLSSIQCSTLFTKTPGLVQFDVPNDFAHIWCFIEFVYALPAIGQTMAHRQISGDGVIWAGCTFMRLLGYPEKHKLNSFLYHLAYTRSIEIHKDQISALPDETDGVIIMSNYIRTINEDIYKFLDKNIEAAAPKGTLFAVPEKRDLKESTEKKA